MKKTHEEQMAILKEIRKNALASVIHTTITLQATRERLWMVPLKDVDLQTLSEEILEALQRAGME